jgi:hypothetical protein
MPAYRTSTHTPPQLALNSSKLYGIYDIKEARSTRLEYVVE